MEKNCTVVIFEEGACIVEGIPGGNRVAKVQDHMADWEKQGIVVEPLHHWPGTDNIADIATKGEATVSDIVSGSAWQQGPDALRLGQEQWPASRDFIWTIPEEERSPNYAAHVTGGIPLRSLSDLVTTVSELMTYSDELRKVVSILARELWSRTLKVSVLLLWRRPAQRVSASLAICCSLWSLIASAARWKRK